MEEELEELSGIETEAAWRNGMLERNHMATGNMLRLVTTDGSDRERYSTSQDVRCRELHDEQARPFTG